MLLLPAAAQLGHPLVPVVPCLVVGGEAAAVHPGGAALHGDHPVGDPGQQLPVVADEQHRLRRRQQPLLQPQLARHVEVVVRLVQQQHLGRPAQQRLQGQPFLLAAGQRGQLPVLAPVVLHAERGDRHGVPEHLGGVAAGVAPVRQRVRVAQLGLLVVDLHQRQLGRRQRRPGLLDGRRAQPDQEVLDRRVVAHRADELPHHAQAAGLGDAALLGRQVAGDDPQQGGLAGAVGAHQRGLRPLADPEVQRRRAAPGRPTVDAGRTGRRDNPPAQSANRSGRRANHFGRRS